MMKKLYKTRLTME